MGGTLPINFSGDAYCKNDMGANDTEGVSCTPGILKTMTQTAWSGWHENVSYFIPPAYVGNEGDVKTSRPRVEAWQKDHAWASDLMDKAVYRKWVGPVNRLDTSSQDFYGKHFTDIRFYNNKQIFLSGDVISGRGRYREWRWLLMDYNYSHEIMNWIADELKILSQGWMRLHGVDSVANQLQPEEKIRYQHSFGSLRQIRRPSGDFIDWFFLEYSGLQEWGGAPMEDHCLPWSPQRRRQWSMPLHAWENRHYWAFREEDQNYGLEQYGKQDRVAFWYHLEDERQRWRGSNPSLGSIGTFIRDPGARATKYPCMGVGSRTTIGSPYAGHLIKKFMKGASEMNDVRDRHRAAASWSFGAGFGYSYEHLDVEKVFNWTNVKYGTGLAGSEPELVRGPDERGVVNIYHKLDDYYWQRFAASKMYHETMDWGMIYGHQDSADPQCFYLRFRDGDSFHDESKSYRDRTLAYKWMEAKVSYNPMLTNRSNLDPVPWHGNNVLYNRHGSKWNTNHLYGDSDGYMEQNKFLPGRCDYNNGLPVSDYSGFARDETQNWTHLMKATVASYPNAAMYHRSNSPYGSFGRRARIASLWKGWYSPEDVHGIKQDNNFANRSLNAWFRGDDELWEAPGRNNPPRARFNTQKLENPYRERGGKEIGSQSGDLPETIGFSRYWLYPERVPQLWRNAAGMGPFMNRRWQSLVDDAAPVNTCTQVAIFKPCDSRHMNEDTCETCASNSGSHVTDSGKHLVGMYSLAHVNDPGNSDFALGNMAYMSMFREKPGPHKNPPDTHWGCNWARQSTWHLCIQQYTVPWGWARWLKSTHDYVESATIANEENWRLQPWAGANLMSIGLTLRPGWQFNQGNTIAQYSPQASKDNLELLRTSYQDFVISSRMSNFGGFFMESSWFPDWFDHSSSKMVKYLYYDLGVGIFDPRRPFGRVASAGLNSGVNDNSNEDLHGQNSYRSMEHYYKYLLQHLCTVSYASIGEYLIPHNAIARPDAGVGFGDEGRAFDSAPLDMKDEVMMSTPLRFSGYQCSNLWFLGLDQSHLDGDETRYAKRLEKVMRFSSMVTPTGLKSARDMTETLDWKNQKFSTEELVSQYHRNADMANWTVAPNVMDSELRYYVGGSAFQSNQLPTWGNQTYDRSGDASYSGGGGPVGCGPFCRTRWYNDQQGWTSHEEHNYKQTAGGFDYAYAYGPMTNRFYRSTGIQDGTADGANNIERLSTMPPPSYKFAWRFDGKTKEEVEQRFGYGGLGDRPLVRGNCGRSEVDKHKDCHVASIAMRTNVAPIGWIDNYGSLSTDGISGLPPVNADEAYSNTTIVGNDPWDYACMLPCECDAGMGCQRTQHYFPYEAWIKEERSLSDKPRITLSQAFSENLGADSFHDKLNWIDGYTIDYDDDTLFEKQGNELLADGERQWLGQHKKAERLPRHFESPEAKKIHKKAEKRRFGPGSAKALSDPLSGYRTRQKQIEDMLEKVTSKAVRLESLSRASMPDLESEILHLEKVSKVLVDQLRGGDPLDRDVMRKLAGRQMQILEDLVELYSLKKEVANFEQDVEAMSFLERNINRIRVDMRESFPFFQSNTNRAMLRAQLELDEL